MNVQAGLFVLLAGLLYGSVTIASRFCLGQFDPITFSAIRLIITGLLYWFVQFIVFKGKKIPKDKTLWKKGAFVGIFGDGVPTILMISGMTYLSSGMASTLYTLFPVVIALLSPVFLPEEKLGGKKIVGVVISFCGALLLAGMGETGLENSGENGLPGYLLLGASILCGALITIYSRRKMIEYDVFQAVSVRVPFAALLSTPLAFWAEGFDLSRVNAVGLWIMIGSAVVMFFGFMIGFHMVKEFGAMAASMPTYISPVVATIGGYLLLSEKITLIMLAGMVLILAGVVIINSRNTGKEILQT